MTFKNGDVFDIGQTVNGISKFIYIDGKWHYYSEQIIREYEYDQADLEKTIININEYEEIEFVGNIFSQLPQQEISDDQAVKMLKDMNKQPMIFHCVPKEISDVEIEKAANNPNNDGYCFIEGAKWYREQLKQRQ